MFKRLGFYVGTSMVLLLTFSTSQTFDKDLLGFHRLANLDRRSTSAIGP